MISALRSVMDKLAGRKPAKKQEVRERPPSGSVSVKGRLVSAAKLRAELQGLSVFQNVKEQKESIHAMIVESTDKNKNPYLYINFVFGEGGVEAGFSIPPEVPNPTVRRLQVCRTVFTMLSLLEARGAFSPDHGDLYTKTMEALDLGINLADADSLRMKYLVDGYSAENASMKGELTRLKADKEGLNHQLMELERKCQQLEERVKGLEVMTDTELDREIVKWVGEHNGKLHSAKFCGSFRISGQRLEERLDSLSKRGVVRVA
jgi:hypothetical protein